MLSRTQAESGRTGKQEQERISPNHVPTIFHFSVLASYSAAAVDLPDKVLSRFSRIVGANEISADTPH